MTAHAHRVADALDVEGDVVAVDLVPAVPFGDGGHTIARAGAHGHLPCEALDRHRYRRVDRDVALDGVGDPERARRECAGDRVAETRAEGLHALGEAIRPVGRPPRRLRTIRPLLAAGPRLLGAEVLELLVELAFLGVEIGELTLQLR